MAWLTRGAKGPSPAAWAGQRAFGLDAPRPGGRTAARRVRGQVPAVYGVSGVVGKHGPAAHGGRPQMF